MRGRRIAIVGGGIFGVTAAIALAGRGHRVSILDPGPLPHPLAASTDISKVIRLDYGADEDYTGLMETALDGWRRWNAEWPTPLFHETGVAFLTRAPMAPGGFEHASYQVLTRRGHRLERLVSADIGRRFPAWDAGRFVDGYFNPAGGYAESGRVVARLIEEARRLGVVVAGGFRLDRLTMSGSRVSGVVAADGTTISAERVIVAAGAWIPSLLPAVAGQLRSIGQPVFHLVPADPRPYRAERFPVFGADISHTGYYGFPVTDEGIVKIANHGVGRAMHPESAARVVSAEETAALRRFLGETFPGLAGAPIVSTRVCLYADTGDGHFLIAGDPEREGLVVAGGDSGHGFKFAPVLGGLIADVVDGVSTPVLAKFRWRPEVRPGRAEEAARFQG